LSIQFTCQECSNTLVVPDEHAGKNARCPSCQAVNPIPASSTATPAAPVSPATNVGDQKPINNPFEDPVPPSGAGSAYSSPMAHAAQYPMQQGGYKAPHRGGLILGLGIASLLCNVFAVPGILAWVMGSADLKQMKAGTMDSEGYGLTQAGMIIGIIATSLVILALLLYAVMIVFVLAAGAAGV